MDNSEVKQPQRQVWNNGKYFLLGTVMFSYDCYLHGYCIYRNNNYGTALEIAMYNNVKPSFIRSLQQRGLITGRKYKVKYHKIIVYEIQVVTPIIKHYIELWKPEFIDYSFHGNTDFLKI